MKRLFSGGVIALLVLVLFNYADAKLGFKTKPSEPHPPSLELEKSIPEPPPPPVPVGKIDSGKSGISLEFRNMSLYEVIDHIATETGIQFRVSPKIGDLQVNASIRGNNWQKAVSKLIAPYSRVEAWTDNLETTRIWLHESTPYLETEKPKVKRVAYRPSQPAMVPTPVSIPPVNVAPSVNPNAAPVSLSSLPPHILLEPGVLSYLQSKGVELPQEIKAMYGPMLEGLPPNMPISPHVLNDPMFLTYLQSAGIEPPQG
ncbi:hypothetical protein UZ36_07345 [Candidatus Nitromaritima sp. SCGC AAA799-C22]|nr:hypothetical protein UZ36_07345 [Candidatus Nitromaritima sp. SCGC AAA799-C22]